MHRSEHFGGRRGEVLSALKTATTPMSIVQVAVQLRVHPNTVRFHLETLVDEGLAEQVEPDHRSPGRPPQMFRAVRRMDPGGPRHYQMLAEVLALALSAEADPSAKALEAGRVWGRRLSERRSQTDAVVAGEPIDRLIGLLDELGFAPQQRGDAHIDLRHCPFLELAENTPHVVCPVHLGLMQGALQQSGEQVDVDRLDAFVEPDRCVAHLSERIPS